MSSSNQQQVDLRKINGHSSQEHDDRLLNDLTRTNDCVSVERLSLPNGFRATNSQVYSDLWGYGNQSTNAFVSYSGRRKISSARRLPYETTSDKTIQGDDWNLESSHPTTSDPCVTTDSILSLPDGEAFQNCESDMDLFAFLEVASEKELLQSSDVKMENFDQQEGSFPECGTYSNRNNIENHVQSDFAINDQTVESTNSGVIQGQQEKPIQNNHVSSLSESKLNETKNDQDQSSQHGIQLKFTISQVSNSQHFLEGQYAPPPPAQSNNVMVPQTSHPSFQVNSLVVPSAALNLTHAPSSFMASAELTQPPSEDPLVVQNQMNHENCSSYTMNAPAHPPETVCHMPPQQSSSFVLTEHSIREFAFRATLEEFVEVISNKTIKETMNALRCSVCQDKASGIHYGVLTCEGCKGFYRRSLCKLVDDDKFVCENGGNCKINKENRNRCQSCRYKQCLVSGMSKRLIQYGRMSKSRKIAIAKFIYHDLRKRKPRTRLVLQDQSHHNNQPRGSNEQELPRRDTLTHQQLHQQVQGFGFDQRSQLSVMHNNFYGWQPRFSIPTSVANSSFSQVVPAGELPDLVAPNHLPPTSNYVAPHAIPQNPSFGSLQEDHRMSTRLFAPANDQFHQETITSYRQIEILPGQASTSSQQELPYVQPAQTFFGGQSHASDASGPSVFNNPSTSYFSQQEQKANPQRPN